MALPGVLQSIVSWLRAGYPYGVPETDYVPLLALLARRLTSEEVAAVAEQLVTSTKPASDGINGSAHTAGQSASVANSDIGVLITKITDELPREEDVARVRARLATAGPFF